MYMHLVKIWVTRETCICNRMLQIFPVAWCSDTMANQLFHVNRRIHDLIWSIISDGVRIIVSITSLYDTTGHVRVVFLPIATYRSLIVWQNKVMHDIILVNYLLKSERTRTVLSLYYLLINKNKRPTYLDGNLSTIVKEPKVSTYGKKRTSGFWRGMVTISVENYLSDF